MGDGHLWEEQHSLTPLSLAPPPCSSHLTPPPPPRVPTPSAQLAKEFIDDLSNMEEENAILYREALQRSFQFTVKSMDDLNDLAGGKRA